MDFAIAPVGGPHLGNGEAPLSEAGPQPSAWEVLLLRRDRGSDVVSRLASFGHRAHAEAFLSDFLAQVQIGA